MPAVEPRNKRVESGEVVRAFKTWLLAGATAALIAGCGGGGGTREFESDVGNGGSVPGAPAIVELSRSAPSVTSDGRQAVRLFATVKDAGNVALPGVPVSFASPGTGLTLAVVNATTDANGLAEASLSVSDPVNRTIDVSATAAGKSATTSVQVVGTSASVSGPASVVVGSPAVFQVVVKDASGAPVVAKEVSATSAAGNTISLSPALTNTLGVVDLVLTPSKPGSDTLTVTAAGASGTRTVQVSTTSVAFSTPPSLAEIVVNAPAVPVSVRVLENGSPLPAGSAVTFTATRGVLGTSVAPGQVTAFTDAQGIASTTIRSSQAGRSLITATSPNGTLATRELTFVADRAAKVEVQASPSTVGVNLSGSVNESSQIIALVRDLADNPVKGARVNFFAIDPSAGPGLSQPFALTDETGRATVTFYPGAQPTGANKINITASVDCSYTVTGVQCVTPAAPPSDEVLLTASRRALQVRIGTGNEVLKVDEAGAAPVFNEMPYGVIVTDSAGNPVSGVTLNATVVALDYGKGRWVPIPCSSNSPCWRQVVDSVPFCASEDRNENLLLDPVPLPSEDTNGDGLLTPGNVAAAYFGPTGAATSVTTDSEGSAVLRIRYLRDRSAWVNIRVRVTASVPDGTEGAETVRFLLPVLASDVTSEAAPPPGSISPYGTGFCP